MLDLYIHESKWRSSTIVAATSLELIRKYDGILNI
jgi:hypothetical protein